MFDKVYIVQQAKILLRWVYAHISTNKLTMSKVKEKVLTLTFAGAEYFYGLGDLKVEQGHGSCYCIFTIHLESAQSKHSS